RYDVQVENTCFNGTTKEALSLLKAILLTGFLNYDEEWYANPKIQGQNILIDMVDGPNDITETLQILPCK
ncbi:MAG: hypothetical protein KDD38_00815, partial [Bdellovibrionales bacterium]|nr:hypothetical protein [Bdellovibrionales bacterium]